MHDKLVHVSCFLSELGRAIAARFRSAELVLEERIVLRANDGEVVRHGGEEKTRMYHNYCIALITSDRGRLPGLPRSRPEASERSGLALPRTACPKR